MSSTNLKGGLGSRKDELSQKWIIAPSPIHGVGVFTNRAIAANEIIDVGIDPPGFKFPAITYFGSKINHATDAATARLEYEDETMRHFVVANRNLPRFTEVTVNYWNTPWYIAKPNW